MQSESGAIPPSKNKFDIEILDPFFTDPFCDLTSKILSNRVKLFMSFCFNILAAPFTVAVAVSRVKGSSSSNSPSLPTFIPLALLLVLAVLLQVLELAAEGVVVFALVFYIMFCAGVSITRGEVRRHLDIDGHPLEDFLLSLILYPSVAVQMDLTTKRILASRRQVINGTQNEGYE